MNHQAIRNRVVLLTNALRNDNLPPEEATAITLDILVFAIETRESCHLLNYILNRLTATPTL